MTRQYFSYFLLLGVILVGTDLAYGQADVERFERQLETIQRQTRLNVDLSIPAEERTLIDYGGYTTINFLTLDDPENHNHTLWQTDLNAYAHVDVDGVHDFFVRVRTTYRAFNHGDGFDSSGDSDWVEPTLDRGIYRFDLQRAMQVYGDKTIKDNIVAQGGRQLVQWANGLVLSQDMDGGVVDFTHDIFSLRVLAGLTRGTDIDFDNSRPDFESDTQRGFYGGMLSVQVTPQHRPFVYGLVQDDENRNNVLTSTDAGQNPLTTHFRYDSFYIGGGSQGAFSDRILYAVEMVYEGGSTLSSSEDADGNALTTPQTSDPISAGAADARLDYLFTDANHSRLSAELILATGDTDRRITNTTIGGNRAGTTDHAFNAMGLLNTGLAFAPQVSNLVVGRVGGSTIPLPNAPLFDRLQFGADALVFSKLNSGAPIDEQTDHEGYLGFETDLYVNWQITSDVALAVRYGIFFPGDAMRSAAERNFFYTGLTFSF